MPLQRERPLGQRTFSSVGLALSMCGRFRPLVCRLMLAKVAGGTGAGRKMGTVKQERKWPWTCANRHRNPAYAITCLRDGCREKRRG